MVEYSKKVMENFFHPKNMGEIKNPDGFAKVGNRICGDLVWIYINVDEKKIIKDIKFKTFGCAAAIASSSIVTQLAKGKKLNDAKKIKQKDIIKHLDGLPTFKLHCSGMVITALMKSIKDFERREK